VVESSVKWVFEFLKNRWFQFFKYFRIKEPSMLVVSKASTVFMEELIKNRPLIFGWFF
jgi:hypothetical protein